jgi:hypothetical protein
MYECDVSGGKVEDIPQLEAPIAMAFGRWPHNYPPQTVLWPQDFPPFMETTALYPNNSSQYTHHGVAYNVPCFLPDFEYEITEVECPDPYVPPEDENNPRKCVKPCPPPAYTDEEYTTMWYISTIIGLVGFSLNIFMAATWLIAEKKFFDGIPFQVPECCTLLVLSYGVLSCVVLRLVLSCALSYLVPCLWYFVSGILLLVPCLGCLCLAWPWS